jgi:hypothetical protein
MMSSQGHDSASGRSCGWVCRNVDSGCGTDDVDVAKTPPAAGRMKTVGLGYLGISGWMPLSSMHCGIGR